MYSEFSSQLLCVKSLRFTMERLMTYALEFGMFSLKNVEPARMFGQ